MNGLTREQFLQLWPNASESTLQANGYAAGPEKTSVARAERPVRDEPLAAPQTPTASPERHLVRVTSRRVKLLDKDNLYGGAKPYVDTLRYCGAIREDSPDAIELQILQEKVPHYDLEETVIEVYRL